MQMADIHLRIRLARDRAGLSQAALAARIGVQRSAANQWESALARKEPSTRHLAKIALVTGVSFEWLATGRGEMIWNSPGIAEAVAGQGRLGPREQRLLRLFENLSERQQQALLTLLDAAE
jgi:transcriptional regulator with XRE-family HTH domain